MKMWNKKVHIQNLCEMKISCMHICWPYINTSFMYTDNSVCSSNRVRLAEWSKAPDLSSGTRKRAWVRTPHLTVSHLFTLFSFELYRRSSEKILKQRDPQSHPLAMRCLDPRHLRFCANHLCTASKVRLH